MNYKLKEPTQISALLDVESLGIDLYRSKKVILPPKSRGAYILLDGGPPLTRGSVVGVFGGLVTSHALVAATRSVKPEFHLHVRPTTSSEHLSAHAPAQSLHVGPIAQNEEYV